MWCSTFSHVQLHCTDTQESWQTVITGSEGVLSTHPAHILVSQLCHFSQAPIAASKISWRYAVFETPGNKLHSHTFTHTVHEHTQMHLLNLCLSLMHTDRHSVCAPSLRGCRLHREQMQVCLTLWCRGTGSCIMFQYIHMQSKAQVHTTGHVI